MEDRLKKTLLQMMVTAIALLLGDYLMDSVRFQEPWVAIITAVVLGILNTFLRPLLILLTIPVTIFTLGLFLLFINAIMLVVADQLIDGFHIETFGSAFLLSLLLSLVNAFFGAKVKVVRQRSDDHFDPHEEL
jgi:putative membrane protein